MRQAAIDRVYKSNAAGKGLLLFRKAKVRLSFTRCTWPLTLPQARQEQEFRRFEPILHQLPDCERSARFRHHPITGSLKQNAMAKFFKVVLTALAVSIAAFVVYGLAKATSGNYLLNASFITSLLVILGAAVLLYLLFRGVKFIWTLACFAAILFIQGCNYAKSNQQVVVSDDCGMTWKKINAGDAVPKGMGNPCYMKVVMPNYPMQGDSRFVSNFKDRVRAAVHIDYDYSITDPLAFIRQAKYLGKANTNADADGALNPDAFEGAENMVIDKRIRDVSKSILLSEDIVELEQAELENHLFTESNKVLEPLGIHLNFITLTFDLDEQTRQAIDVSTAMKIYDSKGLTDVGKQVISARAGATKITVETKAAEPAKPE